MKPSLRLGFLCVCASTPPDWTLRAPPASKLSARSKMLRSPLSSCRLQTSLRASSMHAKHGPPHFLEDLHLRRWFELHTGRSVRSPSVSSCFDLLNSCSDPFMSLPWPFVIFTSWTSCSSRCTRKNRQVHITKSFFVVRGCLASSALAGSLRRLERG